MKIPDGSSKVNIRKGKVGSPLTYPIICSVPKHTNINKIVRINVAFTLLVST